METKEAFKTTGMDLTCGDLERQRSLYRFYSGTAPTSKMIGGNFHRICLVAPVDLSEPCRFHLEAGRYWSIIGLTHFKITELILGETDWLRFHFLAGLNFGIWTTWEGFKKDIGAKEYNLGPHNAFRTAPTPEPEIREGGPRP